MTIEAGAMARAKQAASLAGELGADTTDVNEATDASLSGEAAALDRPGFSQGGMGQERNDEGQLGKSTGAQATETEAATEPTVTEATYALSTPRVATGHSFTYQYDRNKNITGRTQNGAADAFTYDPLNRIQQESGLSGSKKYAYDPRGNIQQVEGRTTRGLTDANFTFDSLNQLTQVKLENGKEVSYTYNGDGLLYERVEGDQRTRYYYDEEAKLIAEAEVKGGVASVSYTYIYDLGGRLWSRVDQATSGVQYYELNDHGDVVGLFQKQADEIYYVHIGDEIIEVTGEHPFWLDGKGWTFVKDLRVGDLLVSSDGSKLAIDKIEKEPREATVYNFEVAGFSSYFVSNLGIWVHNCSIFGFKVADVPNMSKSQLLGNLPDGWKYTDNNGFVHV